MISINIKTDLASNEQLGDILDDIRAKLWTDAIRGSGVVIETPYEWEIVPLTEPA